MKFCLSLVILSVLLLTVHCDDDDEWFPSNSTEAGAIGNWEGTSEEDEVDFLFTVGSNRRYTFTATSGDTILEQQRGSWDLIDSGITFTPEVCESTEEDENGELSSVDCDTSSSVTAPNNGTWTLTAGSYGEMEFTRQ